MSALKKCLFYSQTSWYRHQRDRAKCPHYRGVCFTVKPLDTDTKEAEPSVCVTEVSVLLSNLLNMHTKVTVPSVHITEMSVLHSKLLNVDTKGRNQASTSQRSLFYSRTSWYRHQRDRAKCPHHRGVCITVKPPDTDTNEIKPSVYITEVSVLQSNLLNMDV